jgi:hypothetical protein
VVLTVKDECNGETMRENYPNIDEEEDEGKEPDDRIQIDLKIVQSGDADEIGNSVSSAFVSEEF